MSYFMAVILGIVQGVAEFLPISSSGHLILLQHFFSEMEEPDNLYNILLHFATLIAVCVAYWGDVRDMVLEFFRAMGSFFSKPPAKGNVPPARRLVLLIIVSTLPLLVLAPITDLIEDIGNTPVFVSCALLITGFILFFSDNMAHGKKTARNATIKDALLVGLAQGVATIPGLSRSGCTISAGMLLGFERKFAVRYSFLMSLPAVLGATLLKVIKTIGTEVDPALLPKYLLGMVVAGVVGYFAIQLVKLLAEKGKFGAFAYYCWLVGAISLAAALAGFPA